MILTCPECATRYQTDAAAFLPDGRKVRCAKCSHVWLQAPPAVDFSDTEEPPPAAATPEVPQRSAFAPQPFARPSGSATQTPKRWIEPLGVVLGWAGLALIVLVIGWSAVRFRQDIASLWPQSASLFSAMGLPVNARGIAFTDVSYHRETQNGQSVLAVTGKLVNISTHELSVPPIRVALIDGDKRELYHWSFSPDVTTLRPGQVAPFLTRLPNPPAAASHLEVRFAEHGN